MLLPLFTLFFPMAGASELGLRPRHLPLYVEFASAEGGMVHVAPRTVNVLTRHAEPESTLGFFNEAFMPYHDNSWRKPTDTNLISICGVKLSDVQKEKIEGTNKIPIEIRIDISAFKKPENIRMTDEEVLALIQQAVALNFPDYQVVTLKSEP